MIGKARKSGKGEMKEHNENVEQEEEEKIRSAVMIMTEIVRKIDMTEGVKKRR